MGKKAPKPPNPYQTAQAQSQMNAETARVQAALNRANTYTPLGNILHRPMNERWVEEQLNIKRRDFEDRLARWDPSSGESQPKWNEAAERAALQAAAPYKDRWETIVELSPEQQRILNRQQQLAEAAGDLGLSLFHRVGFSFAQPLSTGQFAPWQTVQDRTGGLAFGVPPRSDSFVFGVPSRSDDLVFDVPSRSRALVFDTPSYVGRLQWQPQYTMFGDPIVDRRRVEEALLSRLEPQFQRDREALESRLLAQGFVPGAEAYNRAADELARARNDARMQAVLAGGQEQSRLAGLSLADMAARNAVVGQAFSQDLASAQFRNAAIQAAFNQDLASAQFANSAIGQAFSQDLASAQHRNAALQAAFLQSLASAQLRNAALGQAAGMDQARAALNNQVRQAQLAEAVALRNQPVNEIATLFGLGPQLQMPQQVPIAPVGVATPDLMSMVNNQYAQQASMYGANMGALGQLGAAGLFGLGRWAAAGFPLPAFLSDRRFKRDVTRIGEAHNGLPLYRFRYTFDDAWHVGVMADEAKAVRPDAVIERNGVQYVDYARLFDEESR